MAAIGSDSLAGLLRKDTSKSVRGVMSFKSYTCITNTITTVPPEGWALKSGAVIVMHNNDASPAYSLDCDPYTSYFDGAAPIQQGMSSEDFHELFPLVVLLMFAGFCVKTLTKVFTTSNGTRNTDTIDES